MWASQRAAGNFTEIKNLLVGAQYTVRVSLSTHSSHWLDLGTWGDGCCFLRTPCLPSEMLISSMLSTQPLALEGVIITLHILSQCHTELAIKLPSDNQEFLVTLVCLPFAQIFC